MHGWVASTRDTARCVAVVQGACSAQYTLHCAHAPTPTEPQQVHLHTELCRLAVPSMLPVSAPIKQIFSFYFFFSLDDHSS